LLFLQICNCCQSQGDDATLNGVQSSANTNTSATNISAANTSYTSSAELCSIATDDMTLSNELQNAISAPAVNFFLRINCETEVHRIFKNLPAQNHQTYIEVQTFGKKIKLFLLVFTKHNKLTFAR
jgi:hypothetical protein